MENGSKKYFTTLNELIKDLEKGWIDYVCHMMEIVVAVSHLLLCCMIKISLVTEINLIMNTDILILHHC